MKAIILAAGMATRLRPVTDNLPKCLLTIGGKTIIRRQVDTLLNEGVEEIFVVTGFRSELVEQHIDFYYPGKKIRVIKNKDYESTGPAYSLWCAGEILGKSETIYLNGDLVSDPRVIKNLIESDKGSITAVSRNPWDLEQVKVSINRDQSVSALGKWIEAGKSYGEFVGATKMSKEFGLSLKLVLENLKKNNSLANKFAADALNETLSKAESGLMYIHDVTDYKTMEIDTILDLKTAGKMWRHKTIGKLETVMRVALARIVNIASFMLPRSNRKMIFIGWHSNQGSEIFADNSKYLFLHAYNEYKETVRPIWISKDRNMAQILRSAGMEACYVYSIAGIWHALTSGFTIIDSHLSRDNWQFAGRSKVIQLWHGKGMKKSGLVQNASIGKLGKFISPELHRKPALLAASSDFTATLMSDIFRVPRNKVIVTGLPRNDALFRDIAGSKVGVDEKCAAIISGFKKEGASKIIAYMPTFRRNSSNPLDQLNLEEINEMLENKNFRMIINLHPKFSSMRYEDLSRWKNIKVVNAGHDIYPLLKGIDSMITDYSSVYVDYLLLDHPIIFYTYDRESYEKETGLYEDFDDLTPGPHIKTSSELVKAIASYDDTLWKGKRREVTDKLHTFKDGEASSRILQEIIMRFDLEKPSR